MTAQRDPRLAGLAYVLTLNDGMKMTDTRRLRAKCRRGGKPLEASGGKPLEARSGSEDLRR